MIRKSVEVLKYLGIVTGILIGIISCEKDFRNVGVNIVDNDIFSTNKYVSEVIAYSDSIERNQTNSLEHYLLGVHRDQIFGKLETSVVAQLVLHETNPDYGLNAVIDTVIVDIPYLATLNGTQEDGDGNDVPKFVLDSIWTRGDKSFQLNVFELGTYLTNIDNNDPTQPKKYYSNDSFLKTDSENPLYSGIVAPNANDTMLVVKRYKYDETPVIYKEDTIKKTDLSPSLKIPLNEEIIEAVFQENALESEFASNANFQHFFRGLYLEALENDIDDSTLMTLDLTKATMTIYFSYDELETEEEGEDLDGDGITGEEEPVNVRTPNSFIYPLTGIKTNIYSRDDSGSDVENYIEYPNQTEGEEKLFVQGAAGYDAVIKLFGEDANDNGIPDELEILRDKNWLINDAQLIFYIDSDNTTNWAPERFYLYSIGKDEEGEVQNTQILDAMPQSLESLGGELFRDSDGNEEKYVFHITDFISEIIKSDSELVLHDLGLKVYNKNDLPGFNENDTILKEFNTNPKGVVLRGNLPSSDETRIKLDIYYSEKN